MRVSVQLAIPAGATVRHARPADRPTWHYLALCAGCAGGYVVEGVAVAVLKELPAGKCAECGARCGGAA